MKALYKNIKEKGALFVLTALFLPLLAMLLCFIVDIGVLYWEIDRLQAIADAAALAGGQVKIDKYGDKKVLIKLGEQDTDIAAKGIMYQVVDYIYANGLTIAPAASSQQPDGAPVAAKEGMNIDGLALQYTNFTEDGYNTSFLKEKYDGPVLENKPENYYKVAVQCGVPVDSINRVRVRIQKLVPTILVGPVFGMDAWPITVTAAAEPQRKPSNFRIVGMHGLYLNYTDLVSSKINTNVTEGYLDGDVYAGDFLCCTNSPSSYVIDTNLEKPVNTSHGYGSGSFTMKGNLYVRNVGTGTYGKPVNDFYEMFATQKGKYLYWRRYLKNTEYGNVESVEYTTEPNSIPSVGLNRPWEHVYNFNRILNWERFRIYNEDIGDFMPMEPHKFRLAISTEEERYKFKEASIKVWDERLAYRREMETVYNEALNNLCAVKDESGNINMVNTMAQKLSNTKTEWRYLYCSNQASASKYTSISAADNGKTIKLLVEIKGIPTTQISGYNTNNGGIAYLTNGGLNKITSNLPDSIKTLNIEKMVVVITNKADGVSRPIEEERLKNGKQSSLLVKSPTNPVPLTGALFVAPSKKDQYAAGYQKISFGDIYSEANLCFEGKELTFNGLIYSEKTINFPTSTYDAAKDDVNVSHHIFSGSSTIFGRHVTFGHRYSTDNLTAGLDYTLVFFDYRVANVSGSQPGEKNAYGHVPMHYRACGLTDKEYQAKEFLHEEPAEEENDPHRWEVVKYAGSDYENYNYHWFNPNLKFSFMKESTAASYAGKADPPIPVYNTKGVVTQHTVTDKRDNLLMVNNFSNNTANHWDNLYIYDVDGDGNPKVYTDNRRFRLGNTYDVNVDVKLEGNKTFYDLLAEDYKKTNPNDRELLLPFTAANIKLNDKVTTEHLKPTALENLFKTINNQHPYDPDINYTNKVPYGPHKMGMLLPEKNPGGLGYKFQIMNISSLYPYFANPYMQGGNVVDYPLVTDKDGNAIARFHSYTYTNNTNITDKFNREAGIKNTLANSEITEAQTIQNDNVFYLLFDKQSSDSVGINSADNTAWVDFTQDIPVIAKKNVSSSYKNFWMYTYFGVNHYYLNKVDGNYSTTVTETGELADTIPWFRSYSSRYKSLGNMGTLTDINNAYIDMLLLCNGLDPFLYRAEEAEHTRVIDILNAHSTVAPTPGNIYFRGAMTYRYAYDLDMHIKYMIDQTAIINNRNGEHAPTAWTDGSTDRTFDLDLVAGAPEGTTFGKASGRYTISDVKVTAAELAAGLDLSATYRKYMASHVFGLRNDSVYTSIRLVE